MTAQEENTRNLIRVGAFTLAGLLLIGLVTVLVNDKPYWWRPCQLVYINVEDATGLRPKSPIRSLGIQIGFLRSVELSEMHVRLGICITAAVEVLPSTRAFIRGEGFLGDKFVELKPVKYVGGDASQTSTSETIQESPEAPRQSPTSSWMGILLPSALGQETPPNTEAPASAPSPTPAKPPATVRRTKDGGKEIPVGETTQDVQHLVNRVDNLVGELATLTSNIRTAIDPQELRKTMQQLNLTLENAAKTLSPEGNLTTTAQRALAKLEDAIEQLRDMLTRVNQGKGSVGMLLNDPTYAEELRQAIRNINLLLSKVAGMFFVVDIGAEQIPAYDGGRGWFRLAIWPSHDRYYLLGASVDPRGKLTTVRTTTTVGGVSTTTETRQVEEGGIVFTGMLGKVLFNRVDLSVGFLHGDGTISVGLYLGPWGSENRVRLINDVYAHSVGAKQTRVHDRISLMVFPSGSPYLKSIYVRGGVDTIHKVDGDLPFALGAGLSFNDEDIKLLFSFL